MEKFEIAYIVLGFGVGMFFAATLIQYFYEAEVEPSELSALRLELDLNQARDGGFANGFNQASLLCQRDVNALVAQCRGELSAIVAECNSRLEACEK